MDILARVADRVASTPIIRSLSPQPKSSEEKGAARFTTTKVAAAPFNNPYGDADVILQSASSTNFYVHKVILRMSSAFFADMFSLPQQQPAPSVQDVDSSCHHDMTSALPIIPVSEPTKTLDKLLRLCYPPVVDKPRSHDIQQLSPILAAAQKYQMPEATTTLISELNMFSFTHPLEAFAEGYHRDLDDVAKSAARHFCPSQGYMNDTLQLAHHSIDSYVSAMDSVPASWYFGLLLYCSKVAEVSKRLSQAGKKTTAATDIDIRLPTRFAAPCDVIAPGPGKELSCPFQDRSRADAIVCSSDGVEFYVNRTIIGFASRVLTQRLSAESTRSPLLDGTSIGFGRASNLLEDGRTLALLFQLCYPMPNPNIYDGSDEDKWRDAYRLLKAATKYEVARAVEFAKQAITTVALVAYPLQLYFVASEYNWGDLMKQAACRAIYEKSDKYVPEMELGSSAAYRRLLVYRQKCRDLILAHYTKSTPGAPPGTVDVAAPTRAMYWSKKGWLSEPNHYDLWMVMHIRMNENVSAGQSKPRQADASVPAFARAGSIATVDEVIETAAALAQVVF